MTSRAEIFTFFTTYSVIESNQTKMKHDYRRSENIEGSGKNYAKNALNYGKTYLFLYNLLMFVMFLKVYLILIIKSVSGTIDDDTVSGSAFLIKLLTFTQLVETIHPILGLVPGGPLMPFTQVTGRLLVNHFLSSKEVRLAAAPYAQYLFIVWSSIEIIRYSFYALRVFKVNVYPLTWCRYSLFVPLYPMGGLCESMVLLAAASRYEVTGELSLTMPNVLNVAFSMPLALRVYIYLVLGPTICMLMKYMWLQRSKQLRLANAKPQVEKAA